MPKMMAHSSTSRGVRTLVSGGGCDAIAVSALTVFNTLLAAVLERTNELAMLRAIGVRASGFCIACRRGRPINAVRRRGGRNFCDDDRTSDRSLSPKAGFRLHQPM